MEKVVTWELRDCHSGQGDSVKGRDSIESVSLLQEWSKERHREKGKHIRAYEDSAEMEGREEECRVMIVKDT